MAKDNILTRNKKKKAQELIAQGRHSEAMVILENICERDRRDADAWLNLGKIRSMGSEFTKARECFELVVRLKPHSAEAYTNLAQALNSLGRFQESISAYQKALKIKPDDLIVHGQLNATLVRWGKLDEAIAGYDRMLELSPENPQVIALKVNVLERKGEKTQAYALLKPLINLYPDNPDLAVAFAAVCNEVGHCDEATRMLEAIVDNPKISLQQDLACDVHFSLGKLYDGAANYQKAFSHYLKANMIKGRTFDIRKFTRNIDEVIKTFSAQSLQSAPNATIPTDSAVFIIGMPRSGTSLVEQILASHPDVAAGGELYYVFSLAKEITNLVASRKPYPQYINGLTSDICNTIAQRYLDRLNDISSTSRYVTNKMPQNFLILGLISILFPQARIIHCQRDPRDTCISCFFQDFTQGHEYAYSLETLGGYYRQYERLMDHWSKVIDRPVMTIQYEDLVADQETQTRRLLEFLDLPWDDACLNFYKNERVIPTASYDQVRQPIYNKSVGRWKHYEIYLQPLLKALEDHSPSSN
jgi:tetratricopeptide (TPR) repeat protein